MLCFAPAYTLLETEGRIGDDDLLLILLVTTWALRSGRIPPGTPPGRLGADELIAFWADPHLDEPSSGRPC
ncbi:hypothetical protein HNP84_009468 [Thermocatellispora tengchongensis]|uniref:Uncharacterized protein n=1 Tax=Thermocatellispora tengchongensis TaxID=1073253 RepID=A0A840PE53_9ACTN|nr:hypothetical protein [Thermocatellispora tengchongensis]MBB5139704.1 hypothetical protein [Thermocatellispora tengchongensis]